MLPSLRQTVPSASYPGLSGEPLQRLAVYRSSYRSHSQDRATRRIALRADRPLGGQAAPPDWVRRKDRLLIAG